VDLADNQHTDGTDMAAEHEYKDTEKTIPIDTTQLAEPQIYANEDLQLTYTFEVRSDATKNSNVRLPSNFVHVLEEIIVDENISMAVGGTEQNNNDVAYEQAAMQLQHAATHNNDDAEVNIPIQPAAHSSRNIQNDLDLWARIQEYDQRMAEEGFTQVLSKPQQKQLKKQVIGKPYQTHAKGGSSQPSQ